MSGKYAAMTITVGQQMIMERGDRMGGLSGPPPAPSGPADAARRKASGAYYTPDYIVRYLVNQTLGAWLRGCQARCWAEAGLPVVPEPDPAAELAAGRQRRAARERAAARAHQAALRRVTVVDPACGLGAFLVPVLDMLAAERGRVAAALGQPVRPAAAARAVLRDNLYGVDLYPGSVQPTRRALAHRAGADPARWPVLRRAIRCGNALIDDPAV